MVRSRASLVSVILAVGFTGLLATAQSQPTQPQSGGALKQPIQQSPQTRVPERETPYYKKWVEEDVRWIITDQELSEWRKLGTNAERDSFIDGFWTKRDPTPETEENEFKQEHYRRIAYSNEHFGASVPGWRTDRGRTYILYGRPESIDSRPKAISGQSTTGRPSNYPVEVWHYRYLEHIGQDVDFEFVDTCECGEYHMDSDPTQKRKRDPETSPLNEQAAQKKSDAFAKLNKAPEVKFKDLEAVVNTKIRYNSLPFDVRLDYVKVTSDTVLVPITIQVPNRELTFVQKDGVQRAVIDIFGRLTTLTGKIAQTFEEQLRLDVPPELMEKVANNVALYWKALPLRPGHYRLDIVVKDVNGDKIGTWGQGTVVPEFSDDKLSSSTLVLADLLQLVTQQEVGSGNFVLGTMKVRPKVTPSNGTPPVFKRELNPNVNFWMQAYNLSIDVKTKRPSASITYQIVDTATNKPVVALNETTETIKSVGGQITLSKSVPTSKLGPGTYQVTIKIDDLLSKQKISSSAEFVIE